MALAQDTGLILLDEPTTYLDMAHQLEVLELLQALNRDEGKTIALVIHELNLAARFSDWMIALKSGATAARAPPVSATAKSAERATLSWAPAAPPVPGRGRYRTLAARATPGPPPRARSTAGGRSPRPRSQSSSAGEPSASPGATAQLVTSHPPSCGNLTVTATSSAPNAASHPAASAALTTALSAAPPPSAASASTPRR